MSNHAAPSVTYPTGRSRLHGQALALLWCAGLALTLFWWLAGPLRFGLQLASAAVLLAAGLLALRGWLRAPHGQLSWDGVAWRWESPGYQSGLASYRVCATADFQSWMVLRLENDAHAVLWLLAGRSAMPERWQDLRRAVHAAPAGHSWKSRGSALPVAGSSLATPGKPPVNP